MSPYFGWVPRCAICRNSVNLRVSKTDEYGRAVHENCYVWRLLSKKPNCKDSHPTELSAAHASPAVTRRYLSESLLGQPLKNPYSGH